MSFGSGMVSSIVNFPSNVAKTIYGVGVAGEKLKNKVINSIPVIIKDYKKTEKFRKELKQDAGKYNINPNLESSFKTFRKITVGVGSTAVGVIGSTIKSNIKDASKHPIYSSGKVTGDIIAPNVWSKTIGGVVNVARSGLIKFGLREVPSTEVFSSATSKSGKLPLTKSTQETLRNFNKNKFKEEMFIQRNGYTEVVNVEKNKVWHISQANFGKSGEFRSGPAGQVGVQDPGLFVSSSLSPLRINNPNNLQSKGLSLDPIDWVRSTMNRVKTNARGYHIKINNVETLPQSVLNEPGFSHIKDYHSSQLGKGKAFVSKRSTIGHGEIKSQSFKATRDFELKGKVIKIKKILNEKGTIEEEALIPEGTKYVFNNKKNIAQKILGAESYTTFNNQKILLSEGEILINNNNFGGNIVMNVNRGQGNKAVMNVNRGQGKVTSITSSIGINHNSFISSSFSSSDNTNTNNVNSKIESVSSHHRSSSNINISLMNSPQLIKYKHSSKHKKSLPKKDVSVKIIGSSRKSNLSKNSSKIQKPSPKITISSNNHKPKIIKEHVSTNYHPSSYLSTSSSSFPSSSLFIRKPDKTRPPSGVGYLVSLRKRGEFKIMGKPLRSKKEALQKGAFLTGISASATFKKQKINTSNASSFKKKGKLSNFKKKRDKKTGKIVYIEKRGKRIKSAGELREITYKGILSNKMKSKKKFWGM